MVGVHKIKLNSTTDIRQIKKAYPITVNQLGKQFQYLGDILILVVNDKGDLNDPSQPVAVFYSESGTRHVSYEQSSYSVSSMTAQMHVELKRIGIPLKNLGDLNTHMLYRKKPMAVSQAKSVTYE